MRTYISRVHFPLENDWFPRANCYKMPWLGLTALSESLCCKTLYSTAHNELSIIHDQTPGLEARERVLSVRLSSSATWGMWMTLSGFLQKFYCMRLVGTVHNIMSGSVSVRLACMHVIALNAKHHSKWWGAVHHINSQHHLLSSFQSNVFKCFASASLFKCHMVDYSVIEFKDIHTLLTCRECFHSFWHFCMFKKLDAEFRSDLSSTLMYGEMLICGILSFSFSFSCRMYNNISMWFLLSLRNWWSKASLTQPLSDHSVHTDSEFTDTQQRSEREHAANSIIPQTIITARSTQAC